MRSANYLIASSLALVCLCSSPARAMTGAPATFLLPNTCGELITDPAPYVSFLESAAQGAVSADRTLSKRLLRILALRDTLLRDNGSARAHNPVDDLIRRALCYYREQREPIAPVPFNDPAFVRFLRESSPELEKKVESAILDAEIAEARRAELEAQLARNRQAVDKLRVEAEKGADVTYKKLMKAARGKARKGQ